SARQAEHPRLSWIKADLFSALDIENALKEADAAVYLVQSMQPSAHLDQGSKADYDLILADNFGRVCKKLGIEQIVFLGSKDLEVEEALKQHLPTVTIFRSSLILGADSSSMHVLLN